MFERPPLMLASLRRGFVALDCVGVGNVQRAGCTVLANQR